MPLLPSCLTAPLVAEALALIGPRPEFDPGHPLGCHRRRISDELVIEKFIVKAVTGLGWERIEDHRVSASTLRRRHREYQKLGIAKSLFTAAITAFEKMIGLADDDLAADGSKSKAPGGGEVAGPSGVDRGKLGINTHLLIEGHGVPLEFTVERAGQPDHCMLADTLTKAEHLLAPLTGGITGATIDLDRGYDYTHTYNELHQHQLTGRVGKRGQPPTPLRFDNRWKAERTHSWLKNHRILAHCTEHTREATEFWIYLSLALITIRQLIQHARHHYRWPTRPTTRRLR